MTAETTPPQSTTSEAKNRTGGLRGRIKDFFRPKTDKIERQSFSWEESDKTFELSSPGKDGLRFGAEEWREWIAKTYGREFHGDIENASKLMASISTGARWLLSDQVILPFMGRPSISLSDSEIIDEQNQIRHSFRSGSIIIPRKYLERKSQSDVDKIIYDNEDGEIIFRGSILQKFILIGVEEASHWVFSHIYRKTGGISLEVWKNANLAEYDAEDAEFKGLKDRLSVIKSHRESFDRSMPRLILERIRRAKGVRNIARKQGYTSTQKYLEAKYPAT